MELAQWKQQLGLAILDEPSFTTGQKAKLQGLVASTNKHEVLATIEDLIAKTMMHRAEGLLLFAKKFEQALRLEIRHASQRVEAHEASSLESQVETLLADLS